MRTGCKRGTDSLRQQFFKLRTADTQDTERRIKRQHFQPNVARIPIEKVEVQSSNHSGWFALQRGSDGTYTDASGFGEGQFTIRVTAVDGQTIEDTFQSLEPGALLESSGNFE